MGHKGRGAGNTAVSLPITVVLRQTPDKEFLKGVPSFTGTGEKEEQQKDTPVEQLIQQAKTNETASTLLSLVSAH